MTDLIKIETLKPSEVFAEGGIDKLLTDIKKIVKDTPKIMDTKKGREDINSLAYSVSRQKTAIETMAKELKAPFQEKIDAINKAIKPWKAEMDKLRDETKQPVIDFDAREEVRKNAHKARLTAMEDTPKNIDSGFTPEKIEERIGGLQHLYQHEWEEYSGMANEVYAASKEKLQMALSNANIQRKKDKELAELQEKQKAADAEKAELEKELAELRAEKAERKADEAKAAQPAPMLVDDVNEDAPMTPEIKEVMYKNPIKSAPECKTFSGTITSPDLPVTPTKAEHNRNMMQPDKASFESLTADMYDLVHDAIHEFIPDQGDVGRATEAAVDAIEEKLKAILGL